MKNQSDDTSGKAPTNVRSLRGDDAVQSDNKTEFARFVGQVFDDLRAECESGQEPCAIVVALINEQGEARTGYLTLGEAEGRSRLFVAAGAGLIMADLNEWTGDND